MTPKSTLTLNKLTRYTYYSNYETSIGIPILYGHSYRYLKMGPIKTHTMFELCNIYKNGPINIWRHLFLSLPYNPRLTHTDLCIRHLTRKLKEIGYLHPSPSAEHLFIPTPSAI